MRNTKAYSAFDASSPLAPFTDIELIPIQKVKEDYERLIKSDVKYRFVIDMKSLA
jgi:D-arabinose 1-dehydrogenase-like Zn-dependent alcohol dehydrogenase